MKRLAPLLLAFAACSDFASPAELSKPQILGLRAVPAAVPSGGTADLSALLAGPQGPIDIQPTWSLADAAPATIDVSGPTPTLRLDADAPPDTLIEVRAVAMADGIGLEAVRTVAVASVARNNPEIGNLRVAGQPLSDDALHIVANTDVEIHVDQTPSTDTGAVAWYSNVLAIEAAYRSPTVVAAAEAGEGFLIAVCRDGIGGIAWRTWAVTVEVEGTP